MEKRSLLTLPNSSHRENLLEKFAQINLNMLRHLPENPRYETPSFWVGFTFEHKRYSNLEHISNVASCGNKVTLIKFQSAWTMRFEIYS